MAERKKTATSRHWTQWTEAQAREALDALAGSGLSVQEFARSRGVSAQRLAYWKHKLAVATADPTVRFIAVTPPAREGAAEIEIVLGGLSLRVREDIAPDRLARLVAALTPRDRAC